MEVLTGQPLPAALLQSQLNSSEAAVREHALACLARAHAAGLDVTSVVGAYTRAYTHSLHYILSLLCCLTTPSRGASLAFVLSPHNHTQPPVYRASSRPRSCSAATPAAWQWTACVARSCQVRQHLPNLPLSLANVCLHPHTARPRATFTDRRGVGATGSLLRRSHLLRGENAHHTGHSPSA